MGLIPRRLKRSGVRCSTVGSIGAALGWHLDLLENIDHAEVAVELVLPEHGLQTAALQSFHEVEKLVSQVLHVVLLDAERALPQAGIPRILPVRYLVRRVDGHSSKQGWLVLEQRGVQKHEIAEHLRYHVLIIAEI